MHSSPLNLLLADDDTDDCIFFKEVLDDLPFAAKLVTVADGVQLMQLLTTTETPLPDALYLDLNMPRKNGFECLVEIKQNEKLKRLPVIIFSTSFDTEVVNLLHKQGASFYIRKPGDFLVLKKIIFKSLELIALSPLEQPAKEMFVLT